jgi:ubiquinone/menaquinone biosynthesis C-methylase UbiE
MSCADDGYRKEAEHFRQYLDDPEKRRHAETWLRTDTVDAWRHGRMYACLDPLLTAYPRSEWLTVGDGRFGRDAHMIAIRGHRAVATDICDALLVSGAQRGYIREFRKENAEALSLPDASFDFVFCKETYHHLRRPMVAFYEMLRVARIGVVLIEPCETPHLEAPRFLAKRLAKYLALRLGFRRFLRSDDTALIADWDDTWEAIDDYVYSVSEREFWKAALGLDLPACAFKGMNDYYRKGLEYEKADPASPVFVDVQRRIARADAACRRGLSFNLPTLLAAVVFKESPSSDAVRLLRRVGYLVRWLPDYRGPRKRPAGMTASD